MEPPIDYTAIRLYIILIFPVLATVCIKLLSEQSYFYLYHIYNQGKQRKIVIYSLLFVSGKKAVLSYARCPCFAVIDCAKHCEFRPSSVS